MAFIDWRKVDASTRWEMAATKAFGAAGPEQDPAVVSSYAVADCMTPGALASFEHSFCWQESYPPEESLEDAVRSNLSHTPEGTVVGLMLAGEAVVASQVADPCA